MSNNDQFGKRISFWQLLQSKGVMMPTIQRDYTYGAQTKDTDRVLKSLLDALHQALFEDRSTLTLDFIYGGCSESNKFIPLDGQQRLTTLYLLHVYAAPLSTLSEEERGIFAGFSYATRESSKDFCQNLTQKNFSFDFDSKESPSEQIRNQAFYLPNYEDDPTIRSMLVVLDEIHNRFAGKRDEMWSALTSSSCKINFDALDFGKYGLPDDLYIKMNARGKPLTEFEIFKAKMEKRVEEVCVPNGKDVLRVFSRKMDVEWSDLVLQTCDGKFAEVDQSFANLFRTVFSLLCWSKNQTGTKPGLDGELDLDILEGPADIDFITSFFDTFSEVSKHPQGISGVCSDIFYVDEKERKGMEEDQRIRLFSSNQENIFKIATVRTLKLNEGLMLYGFWKWLETKMADTRPLRHLRNLIDNSSDEIRNVNEKIPKLMSDVDVIITGKLFEHPSPEAFNRNQWAEEWTKDVNPTEWQELYRFENHYLLRGALARFDEQGELSFDPNRFAWTIRALRGFEYVFRNKEEDREIRRKLLSYGDFTVSPKWGNLNYAMKNRILGVSFVNWREYMLVKSNFWLGQERLIKILHDIEIKDTPFAGTPFTDKSDWRYYFIASGNDPDFFQQGWLFLDEEDKKLEIIAMNSRTHSDLNLERRLMNDLLQKRLRSRNVPDHLEMYLDPHGARPLLIDGRVKVTIRQEGWALEEGADIVAAELQAKGVIIEDGVCKAGPEVDMLEYGEQIVLWIHEALQSTNNLVHGEST